MNADTDAFIAWGIEEASSGFRLRSIKQRSFGTARFTWADLLYSRLIDVKVLIVYFPSRTDSEEDKTCTTLLRTFGENTSAQTSVNFWDPTDPEFSRALTLFGLEAPPAVVLTSGLKLDGLQPAGPKQTPLYTIALTEGKALSDPHQLSDAVNAAHEVLTRSDPREIARFIRRGEARSLLKKIATLGSHVRDELLRLKPTFGLPGGFSVSLG